MNPPTAFFPAKPRVHRKRAVVGTTVSTTVSIVSVTATESGDGVILFDSHVITDVSDVSQLELEFNGDWLPCDTIVGFSANTITVQNPVGFAAGREWRVVSPMGVTWDNDPAVTMNVPAGGVVL